MAGTGTKRIIELTEASTIQSGDFIAVDSNARGTKKVSTDTLATSAALTAETNARAGADEAETRAREEAIEAEQTAREQADAGLKADFDEITTKIQSANLHNADSMTSGSYINETNGNAEIGAAYSCSDYVDISNLESIYFSSNNSLTIAIRYAFYDDNKTYLDGALFSSAGDYDSGNRRYYHAVATNGATYLRYSFMTARVTESTYFMVGGSYAYRPYVDQLIPARTNTIDALDNYVIGGDVLKATANTLVPGSTLALDANNIRTETEIVFIAHVTNFNRIDIGKFTATSPEYGLRFAITKTGITWITNNTPSAPVPHGLTIKDYIKVSFKVRPDGTYDIKIDTNGGTYNRPGNGSWNGWYGRVAVYAVGDTSLTDCTLMQIIPGLQSNVWIIGDSYLSYANVRWPYYMYADGIKNILVDSLPGRNSMTAYGILQNLLKYGHPQYIVWALGMNDADTSGSPNASWQVYVTNFINECTVNGIIPVLCIIPNTPNDRNVEKNNFVKASGCRYIDFAKFVNAESAGAGWYDGMLSSDGTHPTEEGAKALYSAFLQGFPEIYNKRFAE